MTQSRAEYENFINEANIQPLGYPRGYQKEIIEPSGPDETLVYRDRDGVLRTMTPEERETSVRIRRFTEDPRNLRGLIGDINLDSRGNPVSRETRAYAVNDTKERLLQDEEFNRAAEFLDRNSISERMNYAGRIDDAYAMRQLFGEAPEEYGVDPRGEVRDLAFESSTMDRNATENIPRQRNELIPIDRVRQTSVGLRPSIISQDLDILARNPEDSRVDLDTPAARAARFLSNQLRLNSREYYGQPIDLGSTTGDQRNNVIRSLVTRGPEGLTVGGVTPGSFAYQLSDLMSQANQQERDGIMDYLRSNRALPDFLPSPTEQEDDFLEDDYDDPIRRASPGEVNEAIRVDPINKQLLDYPNATSQRIAGDALRAKYGNYMPDTYPKPTPMEIRELKENLNDAGGDYTAALDSNPLVEAKRVKAYYEKKGLLSKIQNAKSIDILSKFINKPYPSVSTRLAGVGGGSYDPASDLPDDVVSRAVEKINVFAEAPFVPDEFEPKIRELFIDQDTGKKYKVQLNRTPRSIDIDDLNELNTNFVKMIADKPFAGLYDVDFQVNGSYYQDPNTPPEIKDKITSFVRQQMMNGLPRGALVQNQPLENEGGRKPGPNKRAQAYQRAGFGAETVSKQFAYLDPDTGGTVPVQPFKTDPYLNRNVDDSYLRGYFAVDPVTAPVRKNLTGAAGGAALSLLNEEVANAIKKDKYLKAAELVGKDIGMGALAESAIKSAGRGLSRLAPQLAASVNPLVAGVASRITPPLVGYSLLSQGRPNSTLSVVLDKVAKSGLLRPQIGSFGVRRDPKTDIGKRVANEAGYFIDQVRQNRVPYLPGRLF